MRYRERVRIFNERPWSAEARAPGVAGSRFSKRPDPLPDGCPYFFGKAATITQKWCRRRTPNAGARQGRAFSTLSTPSTNTVRLRTKSVIQSGRNALQIASGAALPDSRHGQPDCGRLRFTGGRTNCAFGQVDPRFEVRRNRGGSQRFLRWRLHDADLPGRLFNLVCSPLFSTTPVPTSVR